MCQKQQIYRELSIEKSKVKFIHMENVNKIVQLIPGAVEVLIGSWG